MWLWISVLVQVFSNTVMTRRDKHTVLVTSKH